jgi:uncharacterized protein (DUF1810 family)
MPDLQRFVDAQRDTFDAALAELRAGRKQGHWMWFVFPQLRGLGRSETSRFYGLAGLAEAQAYAADAVLGPRLRAAADALLALPADRDAVAVLGPVDAMKLRSCATLFARAAPDDPRFPALLERFFRGEPDALTDRLLAEARAPAD